MRKADCLGYMGKEKMMQNIRMTSEQRGTTSLFGSTLTL